MEIDPPCYPATLGGVGALVGAVAAASTSRKSRVRVLRVVGQFDVGVLFWTDSTSQKAHECFGPWRPMGPTHAGVCP